MYKNLKYLIFFFNAFLFSQEGSVSGVVLSEESVPMPGANVAIKELGIGSITNAEGYFSIKSLEAATYTLDITYIGYKKISKSFVITPTNSDEGTGSFLDKLDIDESTADYYYRFYRTYFGEGRLEDATEYLNKATALKGQ